MKSKFFFSDDVSMHIRNGMWYLSNLRTLTHIKIDMLTFAQINEYLIDNSQNECYADEKCKVINCTYFTNINGLMEDPTHINTSSAVEIIGFVNVIEFLKKKLILIDNKQEYIEYFNPKESFFDSKHYGTFHQQMGYNLMTSLRITPDKWWPTQKFSKDWEVKNNLYRYVQLNFFKEYFNSDFTSGKKILDLGCGVGFYSKILLENGASELIGIDPNSEYIQKAKDYCLGIGTSDFRLGILDEDSDILSVDEKFDVIIISDMLLFYFSPPNPNDKMNPVALLKLVRKYLKEDGILYVTEPHSFFWLAPWMGDENNPYTVITEYTNKMYSVTPTLSKISQAFSKANLYIREIYEPLPSEECKEKYSSRAYNFAKNFPIWWVFILGKRNE